ncbi:MAG: DUF898 family protein [Acidimicrobiia bacterium]
MGKSKSFRFDGGAGTYLGTAILAFLITLLTLGIALPFAVVLRQRWRAKHTYINGQRLVFVGTGLSLFGNWLKWLLLIIVTLGVYSFWVVPRITKWIIENTDFDSTYRPVGVQPPNAVASLASPPSPFGPPPSSLLGN